MKYPTLLIILMLFASCESDQTTSNPGTTSGEKKLVLSPTQLEGDQYVEYEFKAKVTNVPSSDVAFYWDFDEGNGFEHHEEQFIRQRFYQDKVHNVRVKALDYFSGLLLGFDSIRVDIRPQVAFASITPKLVDTILVMASSGEMTESLFFKIKASIPDNFIRSEWDFGDGTVPVFGADTSPTHLYSHVGSYTIRVTVRDTAGVYVGTDSAHVKIDFPQFSFATFEKSGTIAVRLAIDSTHPVKVENPFLQGPLALGLSIKGYLYSISSFSPPNAFSVLLNENGWCKNDTIEAIFSDDLRTLKKLRVGVNDSGCLLAGEIEYGYELFDLELLAVTPAKIIYRSQGIKVSDFARDLRFHATVANKSRGTFNATVIPEASPAPNAVVVINRQ